MTDSLKDMVMIESGSIVIGSDSGSKRLMLMAHMGTVYPAGTLATQPCKVEGRRIYGPGIADDKGGIAVILHALHLLKDAGWRDYGKLTCSSMPTRKRGRPAGAN